MLKNMQSTRKKSEVSIIMNTTQIFNNTQQEEIELKTQNHTTQTPVLKPAENKKSIVSPKYQVKQPTKVDSEISIDIAELEATYNHGPSKMKRNPFTKEDKGCTFLYYLSLFIAV